MASLKNVLGPHIRIYQPWSTAPYTDPCNKPYYRFSLTGGPRNGAYYNYQTSAWVNWSTGEEPIPDPAYTGGIDPYRLIEVGSNVINWGLITFSSTGTNLQIPINLLGQNTTVKKFNDLMRTVMDGGLQPNGGTPTNLALNRAKWELEQTYKGDYAGECRYYAAVLITDGQSNTCNPNDTEWGPTCPNYTTVWHNYPPGRSDELFLRRLDTYSSSACTIKDAEVSKNIQTYVIAASPEVSECELNLLAYFGRTDMRADDLGRDWTNDPRLPQNTSGETTLTNYDPGGGDYADTSGYLFGLFNIEDTSEKKLDLLRADHAVTAPVRVQLPSTSSIIQNSTRHPGWLGTTRRWEVVGPDEGDGSNHVVPYYNSSTWCDNVNNTQMPPSNIIYYAGDRSQDHLHLIYDAGCSLNKQWDTIPNNVNHNRKVYTVPTACTIASSSGPAAACQDIYRLTINDTSVIWLRNNISSINWALYDFDGDGQKADIDNDDVKMLIDFILGGTGDKNGSGGRRFWQIADIFNSSPVVVTEPLLGKKITYVPSNDGMLHAFFVEHNPRNSGTPQNVELFAFLSPLAFDRVARMFLNYQNNPEMQPVGQATAVDFNTHFWNMSAQPVSADIWVNWYENGAGAWRTILFLPLGPATDGMYALDVTNPLNMIPPPFEVIWYWDGSEVLPPQYTAREIWSAPAVGLSQAGGKVGNEYRNWIVSFAATHQTDIDQANDMMILKADTGETYVRQSFGHPLFEPFVPFHMYGGIKFMDSGPPDSVVTHVFGSSTRGRAHTNLTNNDDANLWGFNNPMFPINFGVMNSQPLYYTPAIAYAGQDSTAMVFDSVTGSIYETNQNMNGAYSAFVSKTALDLFEINATTKNLTQPYPSYQHREWMIQGNYPLDEDGDGSPDMMVSISSVSRSTAQPLLVMDQGISGKAYYLMYDPWKYNPTYGWCTGKTYLFEWDFQISTGPDHTRFTSVLARPLLELGDSIVNNFSYDGTITLIGYSGGVAMPYYYAAPASPQPTNPRHTEETLPAGSADFLEY